MRIVELYRWQGPQHISKDPFKTLIGCILSQRTKDEVTDAAYKRLFSKYKGIYDLAHADVEEIERLIYPVGFYRVKAHKIVEASRYILEHYGGKVPNSFEELVKIPGIGRKCANIVLAYAFGVPAIPVDTHVYRVAIRLGLAKEGVKPEEVEETLRKAAPKERWIEVNHALVRFGKEVCRPLNPRCTECPVKYLCAYFLRTHTHRAKNKQNK